MQNDFPKERPDPTAVATAKCLESIVLKALANGQQILEALQVIQNETDKGIALEEMSGDTQDKTEIDEMILNKVKLNVYYSKMNRAILIFFANKEVATKSLEKKTICSGEVDSIAVETEDDREDN